MRARLIRQLVCGVAVLITTAVAAMFVWSGAGWPGLSLAGASTLESSQISRGRYVVKVAGCNDCHTPGYAQSAGMVPESKWLIGDSVGWQGPWGTTYPANLRRFMEGMTEGQWLKVARQPTRPPMPWFALRDMSDEDLAAIYHFIRSLGPAGKAAPPYAPPGHTVSTPIVLMPSKPDVQPDVANAK
jgi:mono/diheme cytochrome c family protein